MAGSQADEGDEVGDYLWTYDAEPGDWAHMQDAKAIETMYYYTEKGGVKYDFPDWVFELVRVPRDRLNIQVIDGDEYHCIECGVAYDSEEDKRCGQRCWRRFQTRMQEFAKRVEIRRAGNPAAGEGAWLENDGEPIEKKKNPPEVTCFIGMYTGIIYPEHPKTEWENSGYVLPINGVEYEIENFRKTPLVSELRDTGRDPGRYNCWWKPRWDGPTRMSYWQTNQVPQPPLTNSGRPKRAASQRGQKTPADPEFVPAAYDTDTYGVMVDALKKGNWTRYVNSSCDPNLETSAEQVGKVRITTFLPIKRIMPGTELNFYYGKDYFVQRGLPRCLCPCKPLNHEPGSCGAVAEANTTDQKGEELPPGLGNPPEANRKWTRKTLCQLKRDRSTDSDPSDEQLFPVKKRRRMFTYDDQEEQQDVEMEDAEEEEPGSVSSNPVVISDSEYEPDEEDEPDEPAEEYEEDAEDGEDGEDTDMVDVEDDRADRGNRDRSRRKAARWVRDQITGLLSKRT